jgi:serine/threonine protein kinase
MLRTEMFGPRQLPDVLVRFKREAQSAGRLSHPHVVTIHEFGEEQGTPYIVMEYMSGNEPGHLLTATGPRPSTASASTGFVAPGRSNGHL